MKYRIIENSYSSEIYYTIEYLKRVSFFGIEIWDSIGYMLTPRFETIEEASKYIEKLPKSGKKKRYTRVVDEIEI